MIPRWLALALLVAPAIAGADIPPPDGYVETCSVEKQCKPDEECRTCGANHSARDACDKTLGVQGFERRCKGYGASVWTEVWARKKPKQVPPKAK